MKFSIVEDQKDLIKVFIIRGIVFIEEQECPYDDEIDQFEDDAVHILGEVDGQPAACGRIRFFDNVAKLERIAIRQRYRGQGAGNAIVKFMMDYCREKGVSGFKLHGQAHLKKFYEDLGYQAVGEEFIECGIPHLLFTRSAE